MANHFQQLPTDVKSYILRYLSGENDLLALVYTCKTWHSVAVAPLYAHVNVRLPQDVEFLVPMLSQDNPGVRYIKHISIFGSKGIRRESLGFGRDARDREEQDSRVLSSLQQALKYFSSLLPRNQILSFHIDHRLKVSAASLRLLHIRQKKLRNLRIDARDDLQDHSPRRPNETVPGFAAANLQNITSVQLFMHRSCSKLASGELLEHLPALARLDIRMNWQTVGAGNEFDDEPTLCLQISERILQDIFTVQTHSPFNNHRPLPNAKAGPRPAILALKSLSITSLSLLHSSPTILAALRTGSLVSLSLSDCEHPEALFACALSKPEEHMRCFGALRYLSLLSPPGFDKTIGPDIVNEFLVSMTALELFYQRQASGSGSLVGRRGSAG